MLGHDPAPEAESGFFDFLTDPIAEAWSDTEGTLEQWIGQKKDETIRDVKRSVLPWVAAVSLTMAAVGAGIAYSLTRPRD